MSDSLKEATSVADEIREYLDAIKADDDLDDEYQILGSTLYEEYKLDEDIDDVLQKDLFGDLVGDLENLNSKLQRLTESGQSDEYQSGFESGCFKAAELITNILQKYNAGQ